MVVSSAGGSLEDPFNAVAGNVMEIKSGQRKLIASRRIKLLVRQTDGLDRGAKK